MAEKNTSIAQSGSVYELLEAFRLATSMGVRICTPKQSLPLCVSENSFCRLMRQSNGRATPCQSMLAQAVGTNGTTVVTRRCAAGLRHVTFAVPGPLGTMGWIESGQVFLGPPRPRDLTEFCCQHPGWRDSEVQPELSEAFFGTPVVSKEKLEAGMKLLRLLAVEVEPVLRDHALLGRGLADDPVEKAKHYITCNLHEAIGLPSVARHLGLSPAHLCRVFKRRTGQTVGDFLAEERVARAKRLLAYGSSRVVDVAGSAGFQSVRQFNEVFKERTGYAPREFRRSRQTS